MEKTTLKTFFSDKFFEIPTYQRDYAWEEQNVDDLFEDIQEVVETDTQHYIGTFILSKQPKGGLFMVVDGQQRLATLTMLLGAIIRHLPPVYREQEIINRDAFIQSQGVWRLRLLGGDAPFFHGLLGGKQPEPTNPSQKRLLRAYNHIEERVVALAEQDGDALTKWLKATTSLLVMEFVEENEGRAIRIFQTVNDRGVPLSNMEKAKSLLIYYSNRFLDGRLDITVNEKFSEMFRAYSRIKETAGSDSEFAIQLIGQKSFDEDSVMRHHYLAFPGDPFNYSATADYVLETFLKVTLKDLRSNLTALQEFIALYVCDLSCFFANLDQLVQRVTTDARYYKLFCILGLSARLYPLVVRLSARGLLDQPVPDNDGLTFADLIEVTDVRVYKTRGTDPARDVGILAHDSSALSPGDIKGRLLDFVRNFANDAEFGSRLAQNVYGNEALKHVFVEYDEHLLQQQGQPRYGLTALKEIQDTRPEIEHFFAREPRFGFPNRGFTSEEDYRNQIHRLGNLTLLERKLNRACLNKTPEEKVTDDSLYKQSRFKVTRRLAAQVQMDNKLASAGHIGPRTKELADFCLGRWPLWK